MPGFTAREIMDKAIELEDGGKIVARCGSYSEMEVLRTQLYKLRTAMLKKHRALAYTLYVSREIIPDAKDNNFLVVVSKELSVSNVAVIGKDGSVKPFERIEPTLTDGEDEAERMKRLMEEDGMGEEEIADALAEKGEADFDAAATKVEEAQAATSKGKKKKEKLNKKR